ncbi:MAG: terpene utilization protein AtuA, partial [bacterium]|nr:terpene utilization protein AtuA [bacterium]
PPGLSGFAGTRPPPSPVMSLFSCLLPRADAPLAIHFGSLSEEFRQPVASKNQGHGSGNKSRKDQLPPAVPTTRGATTKVQLIKLAWGRSGDKGDKANIGIIARDKKYLPFIWQQLDEKTMEDWFEHFLEGEVKRYYMAGLGAINYVLDRVLEGGGTTSLRNDPQAKGYAQLALAIEIEIPVEMAAGLL